MTKAQKPAAPVALADQKLTVELTRSELTALVLAGRFAASSDDFGEDVGVTRAQRSRLAKVLWRVDRDSLTLGI